MVISFTQYWEVKFCEMTIKVCFKSIPFMMEFILDYPLKLPLVVLWVHCFSFSLFFLKKTCTVKRLDTHKIP